MPLPSMMHQFYFSYILHLTKLIPYSQPSNFQCFSLVIHLILSKKALKNQSSKSESSLEG